MAPNQKFKCLVWAPGEYFGGCEAYAVRIAKKLHAVGWNVAVVCTSRQCYGVMREELNGVDVTLFPVSLADRADCFCLKRWINAWQLSRKFRKFLRGWRPDLIHANLPWHIHSGDFLKACDAEHIPCLVTFHLVVAGFPIPRRYKKLYPKLVSRLTRFCTISQNNRRLINDYYGIDLERISYIKNRPEKKFKSIYSSEFREHIRTDIGCSLQNKIILTVGAFSHQKGHDLILAAIPKIVDLYPDACFCFAGEGPLLDIIAGQAETLGVSGYIRFLGRRSDVPELLGVADIFLFPTRFEGESFALLEAAVSGVPIVASNASGIPETFRDGVDALLFDVNDVDGLVRQVLRALADPDAAHARAVSAMKRVEEYDEEDMLTDTLTLLEHVAKLKCKDIVKNSTCN